MAGLPHIDSTSTKKATSHLNLTVGNVLSPETASNANMIHHQIYHEILRGIPLTPPAAIQDKGLFSTY